MLYCVVWVRMWADRREQDGVGKDAAVRQVSASIRLPARGARASGPWGAPPKDPRSEAADPLFFLFLFSLLLGGDGRAECLLGIGHVEPLVDDGRDGFDLSTQLLLDFE